MHIHPSKFYIRYQILFLILEQLIIFKPFVFSSQPLTSTKGNNSWLKALGKCISTSPCALKELPLDCFESGSDGYDTLDFSKRLRLLNFLCDESLCTE